MQKHKDPLAEVWAWKDKIYKRTEKLTLKQYVAQIKKRAQSSLMKVQKAA